MSSHNDERHYGNDEIDECIFAVQTSNDHQAQTRAWELRADAIRRRDLYANFIAIREAVKQRFDKLKSGLPSDSGRYLDFTENPARFFTIRNAAISGTTVEIGISQDGAKIAITTTRHISANDVMQPTESRVSVEVEGNETYYSYRGKPLTAADISMMALRPIMDSLKHPR